MTGRERHWPGAFDTRDLGGLALEDGRVLRPGVLWRSGRIEAFTDDAWRAAAAEGVRTVVDLRDDRERVRRDEDPAADPGAAGVRVVGSAIEDPDDPRFRALCSPYLDDPADYRAYSELFAERIGRTVRVLDDATARGGTIVNCSAGRDRTGLVVGLVLLELGAGADVLGREDELATRAVNAHHGRRTVPHPYERHLDGDALDARVAERRAAIEAWVPDALAPFDEGARGALRRIGARLLGGGDGA